MKKKAVSRMTITIFLISISTLVFSVNLVSASLPVHNVDSVEDFATIQEAIDDADILNGHTILVDSGIYYEHVTINKSISLVGENTHSTIIESNSDSAVVASEARDESSWLNRASRVGVTMQSWNRTYGGTDEDAAFALAQTDDGGYVIAGATGTLYGPRSFDMWLVKTDVNGNEQWNKTYGGAQSDHAYSVVQTGDGGYAVAGITYSFGAGSRDIWLVKTDIYGNAEWNQTYGGRLYDTVRCMIQTSDSGYAIAGSSGSFGGDYSDFYLVKTDASGNMQWNKTYGHLYVDWARSVVQTVDGGYAIAGYTGSSPYDNNHDFWLVKTDANGNEQWNRTYGGAYFDEAHSVVQTGDGGYAMAGITSSSVSRYHLWLVKTDSFGDMIWNNTYGETDGDHEVSMVRTCDDGFAIAGDTTLNSAGDYDFLLVKTDSSGNVQWNHTYGGAETENVWALVQTRVGGYALTGCTTSFHPGRSDTDAWLVKTAHYGARVDIHPNTLNVKSNGQWITAYITLPEGYSVEDVDVSTVELMHNDVVVEIADWGEVQGGVLMVKFNRASVASYISSYVQTVVTSTHVTLTVSCNFVDGTPFRGSDTIRVVVSMRGLRTRKSMLDF